jgi:hypothetical protein
VLKPFASTERLETRQPCRGVRPYAPTRIDRLTTLSGVPAIAWDYKLGNRSAIEWVLDQHKEKTPKDPTIRELFNTYCFADYKTWKRPGKPLSSTRLRSLNPSRDPWAAGGGRW